MSKVHELIAVADITVDGAKKKAGELIAKVETDVPLGSVVSCLRMGQIKPKAAPMTEAGKADPPKAAPAKPASGKSGGK